MPPRHPVIPTTADDGSVAYKLWTTGPRWKTAAFVMTERITAAGKHYDVDMWRVTIDGYHGEVHTYLITLAWPMVWHKANPAICLGHLEQNGADETRTAIADMRLDLARINGLEGGVVDVDIIVDARDPEPRGRDN